MAERFDPMDVCECGDYRRQHAGGVGPCVFPNHLGAGRCEAFRLFQSPSPDPSPGDPTCDYCGKACDGVACSCGAECLIHGSPENVEYGDLEDLPAVRYERAVASEASQSRKD